MADDDHQSGSIHKNETMRWVIKKISQYGISIRFCIKAGKIAFYVSQGVPASKAINIMSSTITMTNELSIICKTEYIGDIFYKRRRKRQVSQSPVIYLLVEGQGSINTFTVQSGRGNVSFGKHYVCLYNL